MRYPCSAPGEAFVPDLVRARFGYMARMNSESDEIDVNDWDKIYPLGSVWSFSWTTDYVVTVTGHTRRGIKVSYKRPGTGHTLKAGIYQPEELVKVKK